MQLQHISYFMYNHGSFTSNSSLQIWYIFIMCPVRWKDVLF